ncbi:hypothetical protein MMC34_004801 [Xylographa carneopallida]|nr:hypothetical protein [Xylographa carneopallida]
MEHLPTPTNSLHGELKAIPYVCWGPYDGGPFLTYPGRVGKPQALPAVSNTPGQLHYRDYERHYPTPKDELESFFQTWLFFGLIHEILGGLCISDNFIQLSKDTRDKFVSTSKLSALIETWVAHVLDGRPSTTYEHVAECLRVVFATLRAAGLTFDQRLKLSIVSTGEIFEYAANKAYQIENLVTDNRCPAGWVSLIDKSSWTATMRAAGWCPSQISLVEGGAIAAQSLYYFSSLSQPANPGRHGSCTEIKCTAYQNNLEEYATQHYTSDCECEELSVDVTATDPVLVDGRLPLLRIVPSQVLAELRLEVVPSEPSSRYVALSHVWADGLGNPRANALRRCQLLRMNELIKSSNIAPDSEESPEDPLFWCDTLCCPVSPEEAKKRGLLQMKRVYLDATQVLVLDASLQRFNSSGASPEELCARILACGWMRRLWTLQEGALPAKRGRLWFQFKDQAINLRVLQLQVLRILNREVCRWGLAASIATGIRGFTSFFDSESDDSGADLALIETAVKYRSVSVLNDEPLLIGSLLDLDVGYIVSGPDETRFHRMWLLMPAARRGIPKNILFRLGPRLQEKGFRWAPSTMLNNDLSNGILQTRRQGDNQGIPTPRGLEVSLSGFRVLFPSKRKGLPANPWNIIQDMDQLHMRDQNGIWYTVFHRYTKNAGPEDDFLFNEKLLNILLSDDDIRFLYLETDFQASADVDQQVINSLGVKFLQEEDGVMYVQSYMLVHIQPLQRTPLDMFETAYRCAKQLADSGPARELAALRTDEVDMEMPEYRILFDKLRPEIHRIAMLDENITAREAARQVSGKDSTRLFEAVIGMLFVGHYAYMGTRNPDVQRWCVD